MHCLIVYIKLYLVDTCALEQVSYIYNVPCRVKKGPVTRISYVTYFIFAIFVTQFLLQPLMKITSLARFEIPVFYQLN